MLGSGTGHRRVSRQAAGGIGVVTSPETWRPGLPGKTVTAIEPGVPPPADYLPGGRGVLTGCRRVRLAWYSRQVSQTSTASKTVSRVRPTEKCTAVIR